MGIGISNEMDEGVYMYVRACAILNDLGTLLVIESMFAPLWVGGGLGWTGDVLGLMAKDGTGSRDAPLKEADGGTEPPLLPPRPLHTRSRAPW